jgi:hypothetical protein
MLENEVVISEIVLEGFTHRRPYKRFQKNPSYTSSDYLALEYLGEVSKGQIGSSNKQNMELLY